MNLSNSSLKKEYDAARYLRLKSIIDERNRKYRLDHPERAVNYTKKWRQKNRERVNKMAAENMEAWRNQSPENRIMTSLHQAKRRAKDRGFEFSITIEDLKPLPIFCPVLGIKINYKGGVQHGFVNNSPSLDRVNPSIGYVKGNVKVISWRANRIKSDATLEELQKIVAYAAQQ